MGAEYTEEEIAFMHRRLHDYFFAALHAAEKTRGEKVSSFHVTEERRPRGELCFQAALSHVLWCLLVGKSGTTSQGPPPTLSYAEFLEKMHGWVSRVVLPPKGDEASRGGAVDRTEALFVSLSTWLLLYVSQTRSVMKKESEAEPSGPSASVKSAASVQKVGEKAKPEGIPRAAGEIAKAIAIAIFSLRRRCCAPETVGPVTDSAVIRQQVTLKKNVKDTLTLLWYHFLFTFAQQLMTVFSPQENEAWNDFCVSCHKALDHQLPFSSFISPAFSDDDDDDDDEDDEEENAFFRQGETKGEQCIDFTSTSLNDSTTASRKAKALEMVKEPSSALVKEGLTAWANVPSRFFVDMLQKARSKRAVLLSKSCTPHHLLQAPDACFALAQLLEDFCEEWDAAIQRVRHGALTAQERARLFLYYTAPQDSLFQGEGASVTAEIDHNASMVREDWEQDHFGVDKQRSLADDQALAALASVPRHFAARLRTLAGESHMHIHLVASTLVAVMATRYLLPRRRANGSVGDTGVHAIPEPPKSPSLGDLVRYREKTLRWLSQGKAWRPMEDAADEVEWQWRQYCPLGMLFHAPGPKGEETACYPVQRFLQVPLFHIFASHYHLGRLLESQVEGRLKLSLLCLLCGVTDVQTSLLLYHYSYKPSLAVSGAKANATPPQSSVSVPSATAALGMLTKSMNAAIRAADTQLTIDFSLSGGLSYHSSSAPHAASASREEFLDDSDESMQGDEELDEVYLLQDGQLQGKRLHQMVFPIAIPDASEYVMDASAASGARPCRMDSLASSVKPGEAEALAEALMTLSPASLVIDLFLARYVVLAASVVQFLQAGLACPLTTPISPPKAEMEQHPDSAISSLCNATSVFSEVGNNAAGGGSGGANGGLSMDLQAVNVFLIPRHLMPSKVNLSAAILFLLEEFLLKWESTDPVVRGHCNNEMEETGQDARAFFSSQRQWWEDCGCKQSRVLAQLLPMMTEANSQMAASPVLILLLQRLHHLCRGVLQLVFSFQRVSRVMITGPEALTRRVFALCEALVIKVVMPCMRVLPPSPALYDVLNDVLRVWEEGVMFGQVLYGTRGVEFLHIHEWMSHEDLQHMRLAGEPIAFPEANEGQGRRQQQHPQIVVHSPARHPYDVICCKEQQTLLLQCLKRLNLKNTRSYHRLLTHVFFSQPIFTVEKLLQQAVGYRNDFLDVHLRLLAGVPPVLLTLLLHRGLDLMQRYAREELAVGSDLQRTGDTARFLAAVARSQQLNPRAHLRLLVRSAEMALRHYSREDHVYAMELLKAIFYECIGTGLPHEEQYSPEQRVALGLSGEWTRFFGSGRAESFRRSRWLTASKYSPVELYRAKKALRDLLVNEICVVPLVAGEAEETEESGGIFDSWDAEKKEVREVRRLGNPFLTQDERAIEKEDKERRVGEQEVCLGQQLLLHLCRRHAMLHRLQEDLEGRMDEVLLLNAKENDTLLDLIFIVETLLRGCVDETCKRIPESVSSTHHCYGSSSCCCCHLFASGCSHPLPSLMFAEEAAIRHVGLQICAEAAPQRRFQRIPPPPPSVARWEAEGLSDKTSVQVEILEALQEHLSYWTTGHLWFDPAPYRSALDVLAAFIEECVGKVGKEERDSMVKRNEEVEEENDQVPVLFRCPPCSRSQQNHLFLKWCDEQIHMEMRRHEKLYAASADARREAIAWWKNAFASGAADPVLVATGIVVPRLLLSTEEGLFVEQWIAFLWEHSRDGAADKEFRESVMILTFSAVTACIRFFMGFTASECRRIGHFIARVESILEQESLLVEKTSGLWTGSNAGGKKQNPALASSRLETAIDLFFDTNTNTATRNAFSVAKRPPENSGSTLLYEQNKNIAEAPGEGEQRGKKRVEDVLKFHSEENKLKHMLGLSPIPTSEKVLRSHCGGALLMQLSKQARPAPTLTAATRANSSRESEEGNDDEESTQPHATSSSSSSKCALVSEIQVYRTQFQLFLCRSLHHLLISPQSLPLSKRNALLVLERLPLHTFPSTSVGIDLLLKALQPHRDKSNPNAPSATAAMKRLLKNHTSRRERLVRANEYILGEMLNISSLLGVAESGEGTNGIVRKWYAVTQMQEHIALQCLKDEEDNTGSDVGDGSGRDTAAAVDADLMAAELRDEEEEEENGVKVQNAEVANETKEEYEEGNDTSSSSASSSSGSRAGSTSMPSSSSSSHASDSSHSTSVATDRSTSHDDDADDNNLRGGEAARPNRKRLRPADDADAFRRTER